MTVAKNPQRCQRVARASAAPRKAPGSGGRRGVGRNEDHRL